MTMRMWMKVMIIVVITHTQDAPPRSTLTKSRRELTSRRYFPRNDLTPSINGLSLAFSLVSRIRLLIYKQIIYVQIDVLDQWSQTRSSQAG